MVENDNSNGQTVGRVLWYDPNLANNVMTNPEDLSIKVEFSTYRKGRTLIFNGQEINNTGGESATINFIQGSKVSDNEQPSLTTRYTEALSLEVINDGKEKNDDLESLGIESIDIEFNTAYQPMIKIKFIDVRGQAILQQGNMSKYNVFFQLPYPIFNLKVKGFYGGTVSYCLHMQRWNASFNSTTGNFEIQADFLGYTYALLTDMVIGLIRASVRTKKGQAKLQNKIGEYGENSNLVLTIDEMLQRLVDFNYSVKKISEEDDSVSQLQSYDEVNENISKIESALSTFSTSIYDGETPYFVSSDSKYLCVPTSTRDKYDKVFSAYTDTIKPLVESTNLKLDGDFKLEESYLKDVKIIKDITKSILKSGEAANTIKTNSGGKLRDTDDGNSRVNELLSVIGTLGTSTISDDVKFDIYDLWTPKTHIDNKKKKLEDNKKITEEDTAKKLADEAEGVLGFEPTIRNIFRVLCINTEIFLEVLREVSMESQQNPQRILEFNKLTTNSTENVLNIKKNDIEAKNIYAWPEYRENKNDKNNTGFVEAWLGSAQGITSSNIDEVVFVNEMHKELLNVAKFDKDLDEQIANQDAGLDVDEDIQTIEYPWYPVSSADTPIDERMTQNPYITAIEDESRTVDSVQRLLLMRAFLLMGVSVFNSKIDTDLLRLMGNFEAENFLAACRKLGKEGQTLIELYLNEGSESENKYTERVKNMGLDGSDKIDNPGDKKKKPMMIYVDPDDNKFRLRTQLATLPNGNIDTTKFFYKYTYIRDEKTKAAYIPVNKDFSGKKFYRSNGDIITISELKTLSNELIFVSSPINWRNGTTREGSRFWENDDGSLHVKLHELSDYRLRPMIPTFGSDSDLIESYNSQVNESNNTLAVDNAYSALISEASNVNKIIEGLRPYSGQYSSREFSTLIYEDTSRNYQKDYYKWIGDSQWDNEIKSDTSLISFYTQNTAREPSYPKVGTYLSKVIDDKLIKDKYGGSVVTRTNINGTTPSILYRTTLGSANVDPTINSDLSELSNRQEWLDSGFYMKNKKLVSGVFKNSTKVYLPFIEYGVEDKTISLFGSYFYYSQKSNEAKALLFLHTIPWQGVKTLADDINEFFMLDKRSDWGDTIDERYTESNSKATRVMSIRTLFQSYGGFVFAPKAWVLFIGGILWRLRTDNAITYGDKTKTFIEPDNAPKNYQFLYFASEPFGSLEQSPDKHSWGMYFSNGFNKKNATDDDNYVLIDKTIRYLPKQVRDEFVNYFLNWVDSDNGFKYIQKELEIVDNTTKLTSAYNSLDDKIANLGKAGNQVYSQSSIAISDLNNTFSSTVIDNYDLLVPTTNLSPNFSMILKSNTRVMDYIVSLLTTELTVIQNVNPNIWNYNPFNEFKGLNPEATKNGYEGKIDGSISPSKSIRVRGDKMLSFLNGFHARLLAKKTDFLNLDLTNADETNQLEQEIFGTSDDKTIKLQIYRTLSSINDKWVNGTPNGNIFSQCGSPSISESELKFVKKFRPDVSDKSLIDTFRFVDRAFSDIGDKFFININMVSDMIRGNYNQSFFDVANKILSNNNFNFIPLPNFINFNNDKELKSVFTPYSYNNPITYDGTGPSFVCSYVGQTSVNLDLGTTSPYPDDGLSFNLDPEGNVVWAKEASDFGEVPNLENGDSYTPVFSVNYGQQNQNYFKNVKLDQREFTETMESLEIIEQISQTGDKSKPTYAGNNLFNTYQTRSYSAEVEMMGSAMIQPMMYFQLSNIPMFRGAYLIYKVNHKITPHNMITTFKGNRVKITKTPLLDKATMYMNLIGTQAGGSLISNRSTVSGSFPPIVRTIIDNDGGNGNVVSGYITVKAIPFDKLKAVGDPFNKKDNKSENLLLTEAVEPLVNMLNDWTDYMSENGFNGTTFGGKKVYTYITSIFRDLAKQEQVKRDKIAEGKPNDAATPGRSPHGWAMAVDLQFFKKNGETISNTSNTPASFKIESNPAIKWLYDNSYMYGWVLPYVLRDGSKLDEHWHWEYHGTSAKCMVEKNPNVYGYKMNTSGAVKSFVKNPKDPSGNEAVYTDCEYRYVKQGDGDENSTTVGASREDMKVEKLEPGFDVKIKKLITNGNYAGINITNYEDDWIAVSANYIAKKEAASKFECCPDNDEGTLRAGFGTDKILVNGSLKTVTESTVFTEKVAKETLVYQTKNSFGKPVENSLGTKNWNKLNKYQKAALISLTYNTGPNIFGGGYGAQIKEGIESGDFNKAAQGILNGPITGRESGFLPGLKNRRIEEARLFLLDKNSKITYT